MLAFSLSTLLDSGFVRGLGLCTVIALVFAFLQYLRGTWAAIATLQALLDEALADSRRRADDAYRLRSHLYEQTNLREEAERRLAAYTAPTSRDSADVPGLLKSMQEVVQLGSAPKSPLTMSPLRVLTLGEVSEPKLTDLYADIVIHDFRPLPEELGLKGPDPRELQGEQARFVATPHVMSAAEISERVRCFTTRRNAINAAIQREALETAAEALDPAKRAMLWAEGGDAAVYAYVAPAVAEAMAELEAQTKMFTAAMLSPKAEDVMLAGAAIRRGLETRQAAMPSEG